MARKDVRVEFDKHDRYGRIVGKMLVTPPDCPACGKTLDVGLAQITMGMAWWYRKYANEQSREDQGRYEFAEQEAKAKKVGLWQQSNLQPPWEFRAFIADDRWVNGATGDVSRRLLIEGLFPALYNRGEYNPLR